MINKIAAYKYFITVIVAVIMIDILGHFLLGMFLPKADWIESLITTMTLSILTFPVFYYAGYRPILELLEEQQQKKDALKESAQDYRTLMNSGQALVWLAGLDKGCTFFNSVWLDFTGRTLKQELGSGWTEGVHPDDLQRCMNVYLDSFDRRKSFSMEYRLRRADGAFRWIIDEGAPRFDSKGEFIGYIGHCLDITERKLSEIMLNETKEMYRKISLQKKSIIESPEGIIVFALDTQYRYLDFTVLHKITMKSIWGVEIEVDRNMLDYIGEPSDRENAKKNFDRALRGEKFIIMEEYGEKRFQRRFYENRYAPIVDEGDVIIGLSVFVIDITDRNLAEEALKASEEKYRSIYNSTPVMLHSINAQGILVSVSDYWLKTMGYSRDEVIGHRSTEFLTEASKNYAKEVVLPEFIRTGQCTNIEYQFVKKNGEVIDVVLSAISEKDENGNTDRSVAVITEITERKKAEEQLKEMAAQLKKTNVELEQFAYIASHDLQEPLRMISSYTQLLEKRYKDKLDQDANDFIGFAVDGANRMQKMIQSFLIYSRTTRDTSPLKVVDFNTVMEDVLMNLHISIREAGAEIQYGALPVIVGHHELLVQLFQNLIGNAVKFRGTAPPVITVGVSNEETHWTFSVKDNGIGIEPEYYEKIFEMFQRLHSPGKYSGTGIGLTICKNIVERHHGTIWVESAHGNGTTFFFTISSQLKV